MSGGYTNKCERYGCSSFESLQKRHPCWCSRSCPQPIFPYNIIDNSPTAFTLKTVFVDPNLVQIQVLWSYRPYQNLGQIDHNLHDHVFDDDRRYMQTTNTGIHPLQIYCLCLIRQVLLLSIVTPQNRVTRKQCSQTLFIKCPLKDSLILGAGSFPFVCLQTWTKLLGHYPRLK